MKHVAIFAIIIFLFYGSSLNNGFVHDDWWQVAYEKNITSLRFVPDIFSGCIAKETLRGCYNIGFYYRPLQQLFYFLTYHLSSSVFAFHLVNLILFFIVSLLVYQLLLLLQNSRLWAFWGCLIFLIHPLNSEAVNWVSASVELLLAIFILATINTFIKYIQSNKKVYLYLSLVTFSLALLAKETAVFLILVVVIYQLVFNCKPFYRLFVYLIPLAVYLFLRIAVLGRIVYQYEGYYGLSVLSQILTALSLYPKYLLKLIYPLPLQFQSLILPTYAVNLDVWMPVAVILLTFTGLFWLFKKQEKMALFGLIIIILGILPPLLFVNKLGQFIFAERYLLFSTIGLVLVLVRLGQKIAVRDGLLALMVVITAISWWVVTERNKDWKDDVSSYLSMIRVDPKHKVAYFRLGQTYFGQNKVELAKEQLEKALQIDPNYLEAKQELAKISNR